MTIPNIIVSVSARPKRGKTHFSMTWPTPLRVFAFDPKGVNEVKNLRFATKEIEVTDYQIPIVIDPNDHYAKPIWDKFNKDYKEACESGKYKTLVIDTATTLWSVIYHTTLEDEFDPRRGQLNYTGANMRMNSIFGRAVVGGVNLVVINHMKERFVGKTGTGEDTMAGWKGTDGAADIVLEMDKEHIDVPRQGDIAAHKATTFYTEIVDCRFDPTLEGTRVANLTYTDLIDLLGFSE